MKVIIPMAGMGKRMRPHTLTVPKPLIPIAGKPIVQRLVEEIATVASEPIEEIAFITGDFGKEVEESLCNIAKSLKAIPRIYYQSQALGTAHAVLCAAPSLNGKVIVAFADTLFKADFTLDDNCESMVWVQKVENPSSFGVVKLDSQGFISDFIEKPKNFVSDLAIIGIYYFKDGQNLKQELQYLIDNDIRVNGEYQLTDALEHMKSKGVAFKTGQVDEWLDCGNKDATLYTNRRILELTTNEELVHESATIKNSVIIAPCFIGKNAIIENSVIGPYLSVGAGSHVNKSIVSNSIIQRNTIIEGMNLENSMIGNNVDINGKITELNIGDFTSLIH